MYPVRLLHWSLGSQYSDLCVKKNSSQLKWREVTTVSRLKLIPIPKSDSIVNTGCVKLFNMPHRGFTQSWIPKQTVMPSSAMRQVIFKQNLEKEVALR